MWSILILTELYLIIVHKTSLHDFRPCVFRTSPAAAEYAAAAVFAAGVRAREDGDHQLNGGGEEHNQVEYDGGDVCEV